MSFAVLKQTLNKSIKQKLNIQNKIHKSKQVRFQNLGKVMDSYSVSKSTKGSIQESQYSFKKSDVNFKRRMNEQFMQDIDVKSYHYISDQSFCRVAWKIDDYNDCSFFDDSLNELKELFYIPTNHIPIRRKSFQQILHQIIMIFSHMLLLFIWPFEHQSETHISHNQYNVLWNSQIEFLFITDFILMFIVTQVDEKSNEITELSKIAHRYFTTWFIIDLFAIVPLDQQSEQTHKDLPLILQELKLLKTIKLYNLIQDLFYPDQNSIFEKLNFIKQMSAPLKKLILTLQAFCVTSNFLVCLLVHEMHTCHNSFECVEWIYHTLEQEYQVAIASIRHRFHQFAIELESHVDPTVEFQNYIWHHHRSYLQINSWQLIIQTVTTVGQGDVTTFETSERVWRILNMIVGVYLFTLLTSAMIDIQFSEKEDQDDMALLFQGKYQIFIDTHSNGKSYLSKEIDFVEEFSGDTKKMLYNSLQNIYQNKIPFLSAMSMSFFIEFMKIGVFKRQINGDIIISQDSILNIYSGEIGSTLNLYAITGNQHQQQCGSGDQIGYWNFMNIPFEIEQVSINNAEVIQIHVHAFHNVQINHNGKNTLVDLLINQVTEIQILKGIIKLIRYMGNQVNEKDWYNISQFLTMNVTDCNIIDRIMIMIKTKYQLKRKMQEKSNDLIYKKQEKLIDQRLWKVIFDRARFRISDLIKFEFFSDIQ